jgi:hypothetical protein
VKTSREFVHIEDPDVAVLAGCEEQGAFGLECVDAVACFACGYGGHGCATVEEVDVSLKVGDGVVVRGEDIDDRRDGYGGRGMEKFFQFVDVCPVQSVALGSNQEVVVS